MNIYRVRATEHFSWSSWLYLSCQSNENVSCICALDRQLSCALMSLVQCFSHDGWCAHGNNATVLFSNFSYLWATYKQARPNCFRGFTRYSASWEKSSLAKFYQLSSSLDQGFIGFYSIEFLAAFSISTFRHESHFDVNQC